MKKSIHHLYSVLLHWRGQSYRLLFGETVFNILCQNMHQTVQNLPHNSLWPNQHVLPLVAKKMHTCRNKWLLLSYCDKWTKCECISSQLLFERLLHAVQMFAVVLKASASSGTRSAAVYFIRCGEHLIAFPQILTCSASPHSARLIFILLTYLFLCTISFHTVFLSFFCRYFMFLPPLSHSLRKPKLVQRRRNTCPSAQDISRALQSPSSAPSASAASLDELIQRCLNCFGQSVFPCRFARVPKFVMCLCSLSQPGYINEGGGGEREWRGRCRLRETGEGGQRAVSYNQALFCWAAEAN